jgi:hypothetical protein
MNRNVLVGPIALGVATVLGACGSTPKKKETTTPKVESRHKMVNPLADNSGDDDGKMKVSGLMGTLDSSQVQSALDPALPAVGRCFQKQARGKPYLGGQMTFKFRIKRDGTVRRLVLESSTLGNHEVERCVFQQLERARFDRPRGGGEAEFTYPLTFPARMAAQAWQSAKLKKLLAPLSDKISALKGMTATLYLADDGSLASIGIAGDTHLSDDQLKDFQQALAKLKFPKPHTRIAKVTYQW